MHIAQGLVTLGSSTEHNSNKEEYSPLKNTQ